MMSAEQVEIGELRGIIDEIIKRWIPTIDDDYLDLWGNINLLCKAEIRWEEECNK